MSDLISRQAAIDALCAVCGKACDKSKFVYNAPQDEQVILCPEHYCLCTLPSATSRQKIGRWEHGKEISREYRGQALVSIDYLDWHCSNCHCVVEQSIKPKWDYCPNCGARMESEE